MRLIGADCFYLTDEQRSLNPFASITITLSVPKLVLAHIKYPVLDFKWCHPWGLGLGYFGSYLVLRLPRDYEHFLMFNFGIAKARWLSVKQEIHKFTCIYYVKIDFLTDSPEQNQFFHGNKKIKCSEGTSLVRFGCCFPKPSAPSLRATDSNHNQLRLFPVFTSQEVDLPQPTCRLKEINTEFPSQTILRRLQKIVTKMLLTWCAHCACKELSA